MLSSQVFELCQKDDLIYFQIPALSETDLVKHCFSTRHGGVSSGIFERLNLGFGRGDRDEHVKENFRILCEALEIKPNHLVFTNQVHDDLVHVVDEKDCGKGMTRESDLLGVDGFITNKKEVALVTFYADCVPLYFLDPVHEVIGLAHAGWRGTVKKIGAKTIQKMTEVFGSRPEELIGAIGPSIGACCFEVSEDVKSEFEKTFEPQILGTIVKSYSASKYMLDLWAANEAIMIEAGMKADRITKTDVCTMCHKNDLFSHRGSNGQRGSMVAIMQLK